MNDQLAAAVPGDLGPAARARIDGSAGRPWPRWLLSRALVTLAVALLVVFAAIYFERGFIPGDAHNYLAAGERLNAGHPLYSLSPGDRYVALKPPYWAVPLLSPPPIAVIWRPLAAFPSETGVAVWWATTILAVVITVVWLLRRLPVLASLAVIALAIPITYEIGVGNVNALLLLGVVVLWRLAAAGRDRPAGALLAVLVAVKLTPLVFVVWMLATRRLAMTRAFIAAGIPTLAVSLVGAGYSAHLAYLDIVRTTNLAGASDLSLAGVGRAAGIDPAVAVLLPTTALLIGCAAIVLLRHRPAIAFVVAAVVLVVGWPVVNINTPALLLGALAPAAWPMPSVASRAKQEQSSA